MALVAALASSSSSPTTTKVTHAVRVAVSGWPRRRRTSSSVTSEMVTPSPSHTERGWSVVVVVATAFATGVRPIQ